jgi:hypothetical protein
VSTQITSPTHRGYQQPQNKALHPTAYSSVRRSSSLRFRRRVSLSFCRRARLGFVPYFSSGKYKMKTKAVIISAALAASLGFLVFARQIKQHSSQQKIEVAMHQDLPLGSSRAHVQTWLSGKNVKYGFVPESKFQDYWFTNANNYSVNDVRKLIVGYLPNNSNTEIFFFFDGQDNLINREVLPSSS